MPTLPFKCTREYKARGSRFVLVYLKLRFRMYFTAYVVCTFQSRRNFNSCYESESGLDYEQNYATQTLICIAIAIKENWQKISPFQLILCGEIKFAEIKLQRGLFRFNFAKIKVPIHWEEGKK